MGVELFNLHHTQEVDPLSAKMPKMSLKFMLITGRQLQPYNQTGISKYLRNDKKSKLDMGTESEAV